MNYDINILTSLAGNIYNTICFLEYQNKRFLKKTTTNLFFYLNEIKFKAFVFIVEKLELLECT